MQGTESCLTTRRVGVSDVDLRAAELRKRGVRLKLQEQPFQILSLLLEHPGEVVTREQLREKLWPAKTFVDFDRSLNKAMTKLRSALADSAETPRYVETIPRHGYRFLASVYTDQEGAAKKNAEAPATASPAAGVRTIAERANALSTLEFSDLRRRVRLKRLYMASAAIALALTGASAYLRIHPLTVLGGSSSMLGP